MEFKRTDASFTLPDKVTVRTQLAYVSIAAGAHGRELFERLWFAAVGIIQDWQSELIPDPKSLNLDEVTDPKIAEVITWAGSEVKFYMDKLDTLPKN